MKLDPTATTGDTVNLQQSNRDAEIVTVIEVLQSRGVISKVVDQLGTDVVLGKAGPGSTEKPNFIVGAVQSVIGGAINLIKSIDPISERERAIILLERNMNVEAEHNSVLIAVTYDAKTPELAQLVTQTILDVHGQEHLRLHQTSGSKVFFEDQHETLRAKLDTAITRLRDSKNEMGITSIEGRRGTLEARIGAIEMERYTTLQQMAATRARIADVKQQLAAIPERITAEQQTIPNSGADLMRAQLYGIQMRLLELESKFHADHPQVLATRLKVEQAKTILAREVGERKETTDDINPNHRAMKLQLAEAESQLAGHVAQDTLLVAQSQEIHADLRKLNSFEVQLEQLEREAKLARTTLFRYAENLEKVRVDEELDKQLITNINVPQTATLAEKPVSPSKLLVIALSLLLACTGSVALVFGSEKINDRVYREDQLEKSLQLPVVATIPEDAAYGKIVV